MDPTLIALLSYLAFLLTTGYLLPFFQNKKIARFLAWFIIICTTIFVNQLTINESPLYRMIAIVCLLLVSMKGIVMVETYDKRTPLHVFQWICFGMGWFGMRPKLFETFPSKALSETNPLIFKGLTRVLLGFALLYISTLTDGKFAYNFYTSDLLMLAGMSFILHFGILNLSTAVWRLVGVDVTELFISPYKSMSLKEFWGKRWNMAFSEMTALIIYKPLINNIGKSQAMIAAFLVSGILHEIAISFPVQTSYGLPLLYFVIHSIGMILEQKISLVQKITEHQVLSHIWVFAWLLIPMPFLFHPDFVEGVAKPLREMIIHFPLSVIH